VVKTLLNKKNILVFLLFNIMSCLFAQFYSFELGMTMDEVEAVLFEDSLFDYEGEPDVSFLRDPERYLIRCDAGQFLDEVLFHFYEDKLYIITVILDKNAFDYYTLYKTLIEKYGDPTIHNPGKVAWSSGDSLTVSLERPLRVKYINTEAFNEASSGNTKKSSEELNREAFLELF